MTRDEIKRMRNKYIRDLCNAAKRNQVSHDEDADNYKSDSSYGSNDMNVLTGKPDNAHGNEA